MTFSEKLEKVAAVVRERASHIQPKVAIVLGSGLGPIADAITDKVEISYEDLPGFPISTVAGHQGSLILGNLHGVPVACLKGRVHYYEGADHEKVKMLIRSLKVFGCHTVFITNAAGSLRREVPAGDVCMIVDHINFTQINPLEGLNDDEFGPRFFPLDDAYDMDLRNKLKAVAEGISMSLPEGVYTATLGPNFETPAEIRALRTLGVDLVGMSTIPEVLVARHCGLKVAAISAVTNLSADMNEEQLSHEQTLRCAKIAGEKLSKLVVAFFEKYADELK